jgi:hypothetical protein
MVGRFVLPPPTNRAIRALRGANFSAVEEGNSVPAWALPFSREDSRPSYVSCHSLSSSPTPSRFLSIGSVVESERDSRQEYEDVTGNADHADDPTLITFEMPAGTILLRPVQSGLAVGGGAEVRPAQSTGRQEESDDEAEYFLSNRTYNADAQRMALSAVKSYPVKKTSPSINTISDRASVHSWDGEELPSPRVHYRSSSILSGEEVLSIVPREPAPPTAGRFPIDGPYNPRPSAPTGRNQVQRQGRNFLHRIPKLFRKGGESKQTT